MILHVLAAIGALYAIGFSVFVTLIGICVFAAPSEERLRLQAIERRTWGKFERDAAVTEWHRAEMRLRGRHA